MNHDAAAFVTEIDGRVEGYRKEIRDRAAQAKAGIESGVFNLRTKAAPAAPPPNWNEPAEPFAAEEAVQGADELIDFEQLEEPGSNGVHPLDAPIFGDTDSFLNNDDLDFSIDLDDNSLPS